MTRFLVIFAVFILFLNADAKSTTSKMTSLTLHGVTDELSPEFVQYSEALKISGEVFEEVETLFNDEDFETKNGWFRDEHNDKGDMVWAKDTKKGRMVTISTQLPMDVENVMKETWTGMDTLPEWNDNINFAEFIASPTPNFDVITYGNNDVLLVSGREFVSARIWRKVGSGYIMASRSVDVKNFQSKHSNKVRAYLHIAGARFRPHPTDPKITLTDVVMLADLKGMLPRFLVNQVIGKVMLMDTITNRKHFEELNKKRASSN